MILNDIHKKRITVYIPLLCATLIWCLDLYHILPIFSAPYIILPLSTYITQTYIHTLPKEAVIYRGRVTTIATISSLFASTAVLVFGYYFLSFNLSTNHFSILGIFSMLAIIGIFVFFILLLLKNLHFTKGKAPIEKTIFLFGCIITPYFFTISLAIPAVLNHEIISSLLIKVMIYYLCIVTLVAGFLKILEAESAALKQKVFGITLYDLDSPSP